MQYFGGKARIATKLAAYLQDRLSDKKFVDLFCGSCNVVSKVKSKNRIANDLHSELISLHQQVQLGWEPPYAVPEKTYDMVKVSIPLTQQDTAFKAFIGFGCSFAGKYFGGYARCDGVRNYCLNAKNSLLKKHSNLKDVIFTNRNYDSFDAAELHGSLVYCDIPYRGATGYSVGDFDHGNFYKWAENISKQGIVLLVSEYHNNIPDNWDVVWTTDSKQDIRDKQGNQRKTVEVLIEYKGN